VLSKHIKNGQVKSADVGDRSLLARDFKRGQLPAGARGPQGAQGIQGAQGAQGAQGLQGEPGTAKAYIRVITPDTLPSTGGTINNPPRSKNVLSIHKPDFGTPGTSADDSRYCFDLTFVPELGVASPHTNNNATVGVITAKDFSNGNIPDCPASHDDAEVRTRGANTSADVNDTIFSVIFE
jgi:hypothetical protein